MVDPINGIGAAQGVNRTQTSQNNQSRTDEARGSRVVEDEVSISSEAISLAEAERASSEARVQLQQDRGASLGLDPNFDDAA